MITLSYPELEALKPCNLDARAALFKGRRISARTALKRGATIPDLLWVAGRLGYKRECVQFALACAQRVAHLNPDPRVQAALDATQAWLDAPAGAAAWDAADAAEAAANAARDAANAACDAARAAARDAARAAARDAAGAAAWDAANAARAAAGDAAGAAAWDAANAAWDAANAAWDAEQKEQQCIFLEIFG